MICERLKSQYKASPEELQRREWEHLQTAVNAAVDAAENLKTALHELGQVTGDNPLDWLIYSLVGGTDVRTILDQLIKDLEGVGDE